METPHEAIEWLHKRIAWERWLTELHRHDAPPESTEPDRRQDPRPTAPAPPTGRPQRRLVEPAICLTRRARRKPEGEEIPRPAQRNR